MASSLVLGGCTGIGIARVVASAPRVGTLATLFVVLCFSVPYFVHFVFQTKHPYLQYLSSVASLLLSVIACIFVGPLEDEFFFPMVVMALVVPAAFVVPQIIIPLIVVSAGIVASFVLFHRGLTSTSGVFTKIFYYTSCFVMAYEVAIFVRSML